MVGVVVGLLGPFGSANATCVLGIVGCTSGGGHPASVNWPGYLFDAGHSSLNGPATAITPSRAPNLSTAWSAPFTPPSHSGRSPAVLYGSPTVYNGSIYIGAFDGYFYQLSEATGAVQHSIDLGAESTGACLASGPQGVSATATVAPDPSRGLGAATVYIPGANGATNGTGGIYLWALDAGDLHPVWSTDPVAVDTQAGSYAWSSPTVSGGQIYVGISSGCDDPLVRGGVGVVNQSDGSPVGTYRTVPAGTLGGGVWSSVAASGTTAWVSTGNADEFTQPPPPAGDSNSIVRLSGPTPVDKWTVPGLSGPNGNLNEDFGASPTLFTDVNGTSMVGACNKNGYFYALNRNSLASGPVWQFQVGSSSAVNNYYLCISAAVWDATARQLIIGGDPTTIDGVQWHGSVRALSPDPSPAKRVIWEIGLPCQVWGTPAENGAGVLAVSTWSSCTTYPVGTPALYLLNARSTVANPLGNPRPVLLKTISMSGGGYGQPTFADGYLFVASTSQLTAYR